MLSEIEKDWRVVLCDVKGGWSAKNIDPAAKRRNPCVSQSGPAGSHLFAIPFKRLKQLRLGCSIAIVMRSMTSLSRSE